MLEHKFTRQQVIQLCGIKSGSLSYLDREGIVSPEKLGNSKHPVVLYSFADLVLVAAIMEMKKMDLSLMQIRKILSINKALGFKIDLSGAIASRMAEAVKSTA